MIKKLQSHIITVTETLNSDKSDSNQCYSESDSAPPHCPIQKLLQHSSQPECSPV